MGTTAAPHGEELLTPGIGLRGRGGGAGLQRLVPKDLAERLLATRGPVTRERRTVTILFSDVKGSTAMAEDLDPEDVMEIMDGAFDVLIEPVYRYEGTLARLMGDAVLAFFGAPIAHEDDPERACRAALEIIAGAQEYADPAGGGAGHPRALTCGWASTPAWWSWARWAPTCGSSTRPWATR